MRNILLAAALAACVFASGPAGARGVTPAGLVRGVVTSASTGLPLTAAEVVLEAQHLEDGRVVARSAADGSFRFEGLPDGMYTLVASADGKAPVRVERVRLIAGRVAAHHLALEPAIPVQARVTSGPDLRRVPALHPGRLADEQTGPQSEGR